MSKSNPTLKWNIIRTAENGLYYLELLELESGCSGAVVFKQLQQLCLPQRKALVDRMSSFLYSPVVYTTTVIKGRNSIEGTDMEARPPVQEVFIKNKRYSEAYTLTLRKPARFEKDKTPEFLINRAQFDAGRNGGQITQGLLVVQEIRRAKVVVLFGMLALLSVGMGCLAGWLSGEVDVGVNVTAGLFHFLALLQWSYIWVARSWEL